MRITDKTKYSEMVSTEKYFTKKAIKQLKEAAENKYGNMYDLPFSVFHACANGDFSNLGDLKSPTVLQIYWAKRFADFAEEFANQMKQATLQQTADEIKAGRGALPTSWGESILVFIQQFFGLRSFKEAEQITTGEILIAKRAQYNRDLFQRQMSNLQIQKFKKK